MHTIQHPFLQVKQPQSSSATPHKTCGPSPAVPLSLDTLQPSFLK